MTEIEQLTTRIENLEKVVVILQTFVEHSLTPNDARASNRATKEFFDSVLTFNPNQFKSPDFELNN